MPYALHAWSKNYNFHCQQPLPQMDRSQSMNADCKIPDHSISVHAIFLVHFYSSSKLDSNCINMAKWSMSFFSFFLAQRWLNCLYHRLLQMKWLRKPSNHQLLFIKWHKIKEDSNACMPDFLWHRHEDNVDTGKWGVSAWPSFCRPRCAMVYTGLVNINLISERRRSVATAGWKGLRKPWAHY